MNHMFDGLRMDVPNIEQTHADLLCLRDLEVINNLLTIKNKWSCLIMIMVDDCDWWWWWLMMVDDDNDGGDDDGGDDGG